MTDVKDLSLPEIAKYARNRPSCTYRHSQLSGYRYDNGTDDYAAQQFEQIICPAYPPKSGRLPRSGAPGKLNNQHHAKLIERKLIERVNAEPFSSRQ